MSEIFTPAQIAEVFSAVSTPLIAAIVALIAFLQWRTNRATLREKLFDRRFQVFRETQAYLSEILRDAKRSDASMWKFTDTCQRARFLFDSELYEYLLEIRNRSNEMMMHNEIAKFSETGEKRKENIDQAHEQLRWLGQQINVIFDKFSPFLSFSNER